MSSISPRSYDGKDRSQNVKKVLWCSMFSLEKLGKIWLTFSGMASERLHWRTHRSIIRPLMCKDTWPITGCSYDPKLCLACSESQWGRGILSDDKPSGFLEEKNFCQKFFLNHGQSLISKWNLCLRLVISLCSARDKIRRVVEAKCCLFSLFSSVSKHRKKWTFKLLKKGGKKEKKEHEAWKVS